MELLDAVQQGGIRSVIVKIDTDHQDIYDIPALYDFLETLVTLVTSTQADLKALEEQYDDTRKYLVKVISRLAEISASLPRGETGVSPVALAVCAECSAKLGHSKT
jgi:hypothetical protein